MNVDTDERQPPADLNAEGCILGACLLSAKALDEVSSQLTVDDFYRPAHGEIFAAMVTMRDTGREVDPVSLAHHMGTRVVAIGGLPYIHDLISRVPTAANAAYYAEIILDMATRRRLLMAGQRAMQLAHDTSKEPEDVVEMSRALFDDVAHISRRDVDSMEVGAASKMLLEEIQAGPPTVLRTGWKDIDDVFTGGLRNGTLTVVGARPMIGKSLIACNMATNVALKGGGTLFVSLEMTQSELVSRMLANLSSVRLDRILSHSLDASDWAAVQKAHDRLDNAPLDITDNPYLGLSSIRSLARDRARTSRGLRLVIVDYLGLIKPADTREDRRIQVDAISRGLKLLAKELQVPVVALHQLNRGSEQRHDRRPMLSDLRESGSIEQDADNVILLHREPPTPGDPNTGRELEMIIAKNRQGRTGSVRLNWVPEFSRAVSLAHGW